MRKSSQISKPLGHWLHNQWRGRLQRGNPNFSATRFRKEEFALGSP
jgi:hypothetical protein